MPNLELTNDEMIHLCMAMCVWDMYVHKNVQLKFPDLLSQVNFHRLEAEASTGTIDGDCAPVHSIWDKINIESELANLPPLRGFH